MVVTAAWNTAPGTPESERRLRDFAGFQVTSRLMEGAKPDAMLLHCLPAHRGEEISTAVFEEHADEIFAAAENRLLLQKAVLAFLLAGLDIRERAPCLQKTAAPGLLLFLSGSAAQAGALIRHQSRRRSRRQWAGRCR